MATPIGAANGDWLIDPTPFKARCSVSTADGTIVLGNGLVRRTFLLKPNAATVGFDNLMTGESLLRGIKPEALVEIDGAGVKVGGLTGQPNYAYIDPRWLGHLVADAAAFRFVGHEVGVIQERLPWKRVRHHAPGVVWPPPGVHLRMDYECAVSEPPELQGIHVAVHYELYDRIPLFSKWITVHNGRQQPVTLDSFTSELLAVVERPANPQQSGIPGPPSSLHVETDYAFVQGNGSQCRHCVHWEPDPAFGTQVDYQRRTPCLLAVRPTVGPAQPLEPGAAFTSFRTFELVFDSSERERRGLAVRRMYRTIAPWVTENPLMMHVRYADRETVTSAIDQCTAVGFEMVILTFGSGFSIENDSPEYLVQMQSYADYARSKGVEMGGYSLLASRRVGGGHDVVMPEGQRPTFGNSPCLGSEWGSAYFAKLYEFYRQSGFSLLEHDGSYPGDVCTATHHPGHRGHDDSRWQQWRQISDFYRWCRANGVYLNVPDWYYLAGSNKCGMGYRETNWSLPRAQQVIHTRQNIYDGTWEKMPSMGWMFLPLTEYQGGGAAATIEPLREHLEHYERMLVSNLAFGVQACYRGPRLYDCDETKAVVKKWVDWYKQYRDILESDVIHGRRADGRALDWALHVNPQLQQRGLLVVFNPLDQPAAETLTVNLYYAGLTDSAAVRAGGGPTEKHQLDRAHRVRIAVEVPAQGFQWFVIAAPR
ncbi:MAG: alpha-galactosidase [Planctomycetes bacterium]|nr:alpha-galactosidase [Planctomycetota bacterium]